MKEKSSIIKLTIWLSTLLFLGLFYFYYGLETTLPGPASTIYLERNQGEVLAKQAGLVLKDNLLILLEPKVANISQDSISAASQELYSFLKELKFQDIDIFRRIQTIDHSNLDNEFFISKDKSGVAFIAQSNLEINHSALPLKSFTAAIPSWLEKHPNFKINYLSLGTLNNEIFDLINGDLDRSLIYTLPISFVILLFAFGSIVASLIPILIAVFSLIGSLGLASIFTHFVGPVSATSAQLIVLLVLAIGVDYSLFMISRLREELKSGLDFYQAIANTKKNTGSAVLWSGFTVAISLAGLLTMQDTVLSSMAIVTILAVLLTVNGSVFALPCALLLLKDKLEVGNINFLRKIGSKTNKSNFALKFSLNYPKTVIFILTIFLLIISAFSFQIKLGSTIDADLLPKSLQSQQAIKLIEKNYPNFSGLDFTLILSAKNLTDLEDQGVIQELYDQINQINNVKGPQQIDWASTQDLMRVAFGLDVRANDAQCKNLVDLFRKKIIPEFKNKYNLDIYLSGSVAFVVDDQRLYQQRSKYVFIFVLILSLVFLFFAFKSIVVPIKALILNLLSTSAALGVLVLVFQMNFIPSLHYGVIEGFVPALLFSILFGLSMDYHVFILSRVKEEVLLGLTTKAAVEKTIDQTSSVITSAALIMVCVFTVIACLEMPIIKQLGLGLAVAVIIDATIIRSLLLPASMVLLGKWNWYPSKLE